ncbi:SPASM domain-containing protein [bacterium]|nr:SPASM domain-containing protein [candidate division CSSED10-310 bacterium]
MSEKLILENNEQFLEFMSSDRITFPKHLKLEFSTYLNDSMSMLPCRPVILDKKPLVIDKDLLNYLVTSIAAYVQDIEIIGDVDPLSEKDTFFDFLEKMDFLGIPVSIHSTGETIDADTAQKLIDLNLENISIALDAATPDTYSKIRNDKFENILSNLRNMIELKRKTNKMTPHLHLTMAALNVNMEELPKLISLANELDADSITVQIVGQETEAIKGQSAFLHQRDFAEEILYRSLIEAEASGVSLRIWPEHLFDALPDIADIQNYFSGSNPPPDGEEEYRKECSLLWNTVFISVKGKVYTCQKRQNAVGDVSKATFQSIWFGKEYSSLRKESLSKQIPDGCLTCPLAGWRPVTVAKSNLLASDSSLDYAMGFYNTELEERVFRAAGDRASFFLKQSPSEKFLLIQLRKLALQDAPSLGTTLIPPQNPTPFRLTTTNWETIEFPLSSTEEDRIIQVDLAMEHAIRPVDADVKNRDSRLMSVKFARAWVEEWPKKVVFGQQLVLLGYETVPETWETGGDVIFRTFWRSLDQTPVNLKVNLHFSLEGKPKAKHSSTKKELGVERKNEFQSDHLLLSGGQPSSMWVPGTFIAHEHMFSIPETIHHGHYKLELTLYPEGSSKKRLKIARSDRPAENDKALLGTVLISTK